MRDKLEDFIEYEEGEKIREHLHEKAKAEYVPKYADKYISFMNENTCSFNVNHPQSKNHPYYFRMFCIKSQHVLGDCVEECLDKAIEEAEDEKDGMR